MAKNENGRHALRVQLCVDMLKNTHRYIKELLKKPAPKPKKLSPVGSGLLHTEQQFCYDQGWREGIAAYRASLRQRMADAEKTAPATALNVISRFEE